MNGGKTRNKSKGTRMKEKRVTEEELRGGEGREKTHGMRVRADKCEEES